MEIAFAVAHGLHVAASRRLTPSLKGRPVAVIRSGRAVDLSLELRARGIAIGIRRGSLTALCPEVVTVAFERERAEEFQRHLLDLYARHIPAVEPVSLAETFLDVSGLPSPPFPDIARQAQAELGVSVGFGLGPTKLVARAAGLELVRKTLKGMTGAKGPEEPLSGEVLTASDALSFLAPLPVDYLYPLPEEITAWLTRQGFSRIGQVRELPLTELARRFGWPLARRVAEAASGGRPDPVRALWPRPSLEFSRSFEGGLNDSRGLASFLAEAAGRLAREMAVSGLACGELAVTFLGEDGSCKEVTRRLTGPTRSRVTLICVLETLAERLLATVTTPPVGAKVRAGRVASLPARQLDFGFDLSARSGLDDIRAVVDELAWRYGGRVVQGRFSDGAGAGGEGGGEMFAGAAGTAVSHRRARRESLLAFYDPLRAQAHVKAH